MRRLSSSREDMKPHYTVVVVGSGYGGAIAASRLARADQDVCVLERGREFVPGEYPDTETESARELQVDFPASHTGSCTGLYDFRVNPDMNVFLGCGLGGTSLVNANVSLRPEKRVFDDSCWPRELRDDVKKGLEQAFRRAEEMLDAKVYPSTAPELTKYAAHEKSARFLDSAKVYHPPINVMFADGTNAAGVDQKACTLCGDCVSGCNVTAKNTVLMNYLPDAVNQGAEIYTSISVRYLERKNNRWIVHFQMLDAGREVFDAPMQFISAEHVVLGAGALGSTEILLRSKAVGLPMSDQVGRHFTGNGDVLGFAYNNDIPIHGIGFGSRDQSDASPVGPTITGIIDLRDQPRLDDGMVIEEGALPGSIANLLPKVFSLSAQLTGKDTDSGLADTVREKRREIESLIQGPYHGAIQNTQTFLVMSHDDGNGRMFLEDDRLRIDWPDVGRQPLFERINNTLMEVTRPLGGTYLPNPLWNKLLGHDLVTVHPLGGCRMADQAEEGVVNHRGQVFRASGGNEVHEGLYVFDGAVISRSLGVNPLLTISAIAERCSALLSEAQGWVIDYQSQPDVFPVPVAETAGIRFTERMQGYFMRGDFTDFEQAEAAGRSSNSPFEFTLTIVSEDLEQMLLDPEHPARMHGTVSAPSLSVTPLQVSDGQFSLFAEDPDRPGYRRMVYRMQLNAEDGSAYRFNGFKVIPKSQGKAPWADTTTLYITVSAADGGTEATIGKGILKIAPDDFLRQLTTMEVTHVADSGRRLAYLLRFGHFFAGTLFDIYGGIFARPSAFDPRAPARKKRPLRTRAPEVYGLTTADDVQLRLTRYRGGGKGPVLLSHGLGVSSRIFTIDTIDTNLVEYLYSHGYDVWLLDYRASIELEASRAQFSGDDIARRDYPAAVERVLAVTGAADLQAVVHCFGATTFFMAMLQGLTGVRSIVCSQVAAHIQAPLLTNIKTGLHIPSVLKMLGVDSLTAYVDTHADWADRLFDKALRLQPVPFEERCRSTVCHRITFLYGLLYEHDQLNTATHKALHEMFGIASISALEHLAQLVRTGHLVAADGTEGYMDHLERLALPICFIHGAENQCYHPQSTQQTFDALRKVNGDLYERHVISGYGHIDCIFGKKAVRDVYPLILNHLEHNG